jgi:RND family efflux transporter MFP subunit
MNERTENDLRQSRPASRSNKRWLLALAAALALVAVMIVVLIAMRRPQTSTGQVAGVAVPSVEAVAAPASSKAAESADMTIAPEMIERAGLRYGEVRLQSVANQLRTTGTVQANAYRETRVTPLVGGRVTAVKVQLGDTVAPGQPLAIIFSSELAEAQMKYLTIIADLKYHTAQYNRSLSLAKLGAISQQEMEEAEAHFQEHHAEHEAARQKLLLLGLAEAETAALKDASQIRSEVTVHAPSAGVITARNVNVGQVVTMADSLFSVTDLSTVWVIGNVYEKDFAALREGAGVTITAPAYPGRAFRGAISYIDPRVDTQTRTAQVRVEVGNPNQSLKLGMFVDVALNAPGTQQALVVPKAALQTVGLDQIVFVPLGPGRFQFRKVQTAEEAGEYVRVTSGVNAGEKVVTEGSFFLRAEMGRSAPSPAH